MKSANAPRLSHPGKVGGACGRGGGRNSPGLALQGPLRPRQRVRELDEDGGALSPLMSPAGTPPSRPALQAAAANRSPTGEFAVARDGVQEAPRSACKRGVPGWVARPRARWCGLCAVLRGCGGAARICPRAHRPSGTWAGDPRVGLVHPALCRFLLSPAARVETLL